MGHWLQWANSERKVAGDLLQQRALVGHGRRLRRSSLLSVVPLAELPMDSTVRPPLASPNVISGLGGMLEGTISPVSCQQPRRDAVVTVLNIPD